ncbi:Pr6Pr family membrane protein [Litorihabitans aurantiacus]|uniref:Pr6Pr family membrane protein n=1 Tax=Litorihabitans aurantiacus TaxID=1930061 RepID=UPI0024E19109|nr:Pr6Pr family membrane protein [Litorihabitans aurantiacus]
MVAGSLAIQLWLIFSGGVDANSGEDGGTASILVRLWRLFSFFTVESNVVVLVVCVLLILDPVRRGWWWDVARINALLAITITGLVFAVVLAPQLSFTGAALVATVGFHYVAPWATVVGWLVLGPRLGFQWSKIAGAFILPIAWLVYIFVQGPATGWYPYTFLDVTEIGLGRALANALLVLVLALVIALVYRLLDARVPAALESTTSTGAR